MSEKLSFEEVVTAFARDNTSLTEKELEQKASDWMDRTYKDGWTKPESVESYLESLSDIDDENYLLETLESYEVPEKVIDKVIAVKRKQQDPYYQMLNEQDRNILEKLQAYHPDKNWTAKKLYEQQERKK